MSYTDEKLQEILGLVEKEFKTHLAKMEETSGEAVLAKSEDKPFPPKDEKKPEDKEEDKKDEEKKPEEKEEHKEESESQEGDKPQEDKEEHKPEAHGDDDHGYDDEDMDHMHKMYMSMSKAELKAHHDSVRKALDCHGMAKCGDGMAKSEVETSIEVKLPEISAETALLKSELEAEKNKTAELQKKVDLATEFMAKLAAKKSAPQGKAITSLEVIAKSEETKAEKSFTESEVTSILAKKSSDPTLSKSDRDAINEYYLGSKNIELVKHLL